MNFHAIAVKSKKLKEKIIYKRSKDTFFDTLKKHNET